MPVAMKSRTTKAPVRPARPVADVTAASTPQQQKLRLIFLGLFLALWICAVCVRLVHLQVMQYGFYTKLAARQQLLGLVRQRIGVVPAAFMVVM